MHKNQLVLLECEILLLLKDGNVCLYKKGNATIKMKKALKTSEKGEEIGKNELFEQKFYKMRVIIFVLVLFLIK